ncbi:MAG: NUDIX hydrolase [Ktedonobacteraceae bacterium]
MFTIGAFAIIFDKQQRVLLCHRRDIDRWNLPGGGVMHGETPWQGVVREVWEETGLNVAANKLLGVYTDTDRDDIVFSFLCNIMGGEITLSDEADDIAYFSFEQLPTHTHLHHIIRIKDALDKPDSMHLKILPGLPLAEFSKRSVQSDNEPN